MSLETFLLNDFSGGINLVDDPADLEANEMASGTHDIELEGKGGQFRIRRGNRIKSSGSTFVAPGPIRDWIANIMPFRNPAETKDRMILSNDAGRVYTWNPSTLAATQIIAGGAAAGHLWSFEQMTDNANTPYVWIANGVDAAQKYSIPGAAVAAWGGAPPNGKALKAWKTMLIVSNVSAQPQRVYFSAPANPESWPANNFIDIKSVDAEEDTIVALEVVGENLLVFKKRSVWLVFDPVTFDNRRIADVGIVNPHAHCVLGDRVYWVATDGVYSTDGDAEPREETKKIRTWIGNASAGNINMGDARIAALPDGRVFWHPGLATFGIWCAYTDLTRPDGQHPWFYHSEKFLHGVQCICAAQVDEPGQGPPMGLMAVMQDSGSVEQDLFQCFYKDVGNDDAFYSASAPTLFGSYVGPRFPLVGTENMERIRRINIWGTGTFDVILINSEGNSVWIGSNITTDNVTAGKMGYARARPEARQRNWQLWLSFYSFDSDDYRKIVSVEFKYRGGKEH